MKKEVSIAIFTVALLAAAAWLWLSPGGLNKAPSISFNTINGETVNLEDLRGRPVLVNFWATTCSGCIKEMPDLVKLYDDLSGAGFEILGVAMYYDPPNQVLELVSREQIPYPIALDIQAEAARAFGDVMLTPTSFLIAPDGSISQQIIGEINREDLHNRISAMLASTSRVPG